MKRTWFQRGAMLFWGIVLALTGSSQWLRTENAHHAVAPLPVLERMENTGGGQQPAMSVKAKVQGQGTKKAVKKASASRVAVHQGTANKSVQGIPSVAPKGVQPLGVQPTGQQVVKVRVPAGRPWHRSNLERHWEKHHGEFPEFHSQEEYGRWAVEFFTNPPQGTLIKVRGDGRLFYHPQSNTFGATTLDGIPKTLFRPDRGMDYWRRQ